MRMWIVIGQFKVFIFEIKYVGYIGIDMHMWQRSGLTGELQLDLFQMVEVNVCITNCMNGGYPRWQSQYLRKLVMPDVNVVEESSANRLLEAYRTFDMVRLNKTMEDIVSSPREKFCGRQSSVQQLTFDFSI